jgi:hypothetical protein
VGAQYSKERRDTMLLMPLVDCRSAISLRVGVKMAGLALGAMASCRYLSSLMSLFLGGEATYPNFTPLSQSARHPARANLVILLSLVIITQRRATFREH